MQTLAALPAAVRSANLPAREPVVRRQPPAPVEEQIPLVESTNPDVASRTLHHTLTHQQFEVFSRLCDAIAPEFNELPGALEAGAPEFLDFLLGQSSLDKQKLYRYGLDELNRRALKRYKTSFAEIEHPQLDALLAPLGQPWSFEPDDEFALFLRTAKQEVLTATQNSYLWVEAMSKRIGKEVGVQMYWYPID